MGPPEDISDVPQDPVNDYYGVPSNPIKPYGIDDIVNDGCFLERERLDSILDRLRAKKNLILQGPPGTGKTWLAKRLGYALIGSNIRRSPATPCSSIPTSLMRTSFGVGAPGEIPGWILSTDPF